MTDREHIGYVGVDSGILMIVDPCYVLGDGKPQGEHAYMEVTQPLFDPGVNGKGTATLDELGVIFHPGFGDGVYDVYAEYSDEGDWGRRIKRVVIECIRDEPATYANEPDDADTDGLDAGHDATCSFCGQGLCDDGNGYVHCATGLPLCTDWEEQT